MSHRATAAKVICNPLLLHQFANGPRLSAGKTSTTKMLGIRNWSSSTPATVQQNKEEEEGGQDGKKATVVNSYWGVAPANITKEDGTAWKWNCFRPWESYTSDTSIDIKKHHKPTNFMDKFQPRIH